MQNVLHTVQLENWAKRKDHQVNSIAFCTYLCPELSELSLAHFQLSLRKDTSPTGLATNHTVP